MYCPKDLIKNLVNFKERKTLFESPRAARASAACNSQQLLGVTKKQWYLEKEISNDCKEVLRHLGVNIVGGCIFKNYNARHLHVSLSIEKEN